MNDTELDDLINDEWTRSTSDIARRHAPDEAEVERLTNLATSEAPEFNPRDIGLGDLTLADWQRLEELASRPVDFFEVDYEKKHFPGVGVGFEFAEEAEGALAALAVGNASATYEQQLNYAERMVQQARERTPGGKIAEVLVGTTPIIVEGTAAALAGSGGAAVAARGLARAGFEKAAAATRSTIVKRATQIGLMTGAREGIPQLTDAVGASDFGGGAWSLNSLRRALPNMDISDDEAEHILGMTEGGATEALLGKAFETNPLARGFGEELLRNTVEFGVGPAISGLTVAAVKNGIFGAALRRTVTKADDALTVARKVQAATGQDGPFTEILEENISGTAVEALYGEDWQHGLTDDVYEVAAIAMLGALPGASTATVTATKRIMDSRRAAARKRIADAQAATLAKEAPAGNQSPAGAEPSTGGDPSASVEATAATAEGDAGVLSPEELADLRASDVQSFREAATAAVGREVDFEEAEPATQEEFAAQAFLRRRGIEPIFVRTEDAEGVPAGFFPGEGRAIVRLDSPGVQAAAIEEAMHTWEAQQSPARRAALDAELRGIDGQFLTRVESWWRDNSLVPDAGPELVAEETRATTGRFLAPLVAYLETDQGAQDFAKVYTENPGAFARTWEAIRDWIAERVKFLKPSQRTQAETRLAALSGTLPETAPELAQSILGALREIRPAQLQAPTREQVTAFEEAAPPVQVKRPKVPRERQKKERGGKRRAEAEVKAQAREREEAAAQKAAATPAEKTRLEKPESKPNAAQKRKAAAKQRDALGRSFTPTTYSATVDATGLIGKGLTPRFATPIDAETQAVLERAGLAAPFKLTASFLEDGQLVTKWDKFQRVFSDEFIALKKYVDGAKKLGADLTANPTSAVRRYFGKISERASEIERNFTEPILALLKERGITLDEAGDYAYARHVEEANEKFLKDHEERKALAGQRAAIKRSIKDLPRDGQVEKDLRDLDRRIDALNYVPIRLPSGVTAQEFFHEIDPRSGMKTSEAQALVSKAEAQGGYKELGQRIDEMNRQTRDRMLADGLLTPEEHAAWASQYQHYVPLRTAEVDKPEGPRSSGLTVRGKESKRRKGRKSKADNPLVMSFVQALNAAQRGEKNAVGLELREFLQQNRDLLGNGEREAQLDDKGRPIVSEYEFHLKVDGRDVALTLENKDVADALKRIGIPSIPSAVKYYAAAMRVWRAMVTSANPEFVVNNLVRDVQTALINVQSVSEEFDAKAIRGQMIRDLKPAFNTAYQFARGKPVTTGMGARYDEYRQNGGQIGTFSSPDFQEQSKRIERELKRAEKQGPVREAAKEVGNVSRVGWQFIEDVNQAVETATRFSMYNALRDRGVSAKDAAFAARQLTVDFSQKGTWGTGISLAYAFFSAGVGGTRRLLEEMARSKTSRRIAGGIAAQAFVMSFVNEMFSADDEDGLSFYSKIPDYVKEQYMIFMLPGAKEPIKILSPWGYNVFMNVGRLAAEWSSGKRTSASAATTMFTVASSNFNPMGTAPSLGQFLSPTLADPFVQIGENQNFAGTPIAPEQNPFGAERAAFARSGRGTFDVNIKIAEALNSLTGGDEIRPGGINLAGDHVEHLFEFLGGGVGRFAMRLAKGGLNAANGEFDAEAAVFIRGVYGAPTEFTDRQNFYEARDEIEYQKAAIKLAKDEKDFDRARELQSRFRYTLRMDKKLRDASKKAAELKDAAYAKSKLDPDEKLLDEADAVLKSVYGEYVLAIQKNGQSSK